MPARSRFGGTAFAGLGTGFTPTEADMNHKVFIPVTDEMLYDRPELITAPLRPYQVGSPCFHWLAVIETPESADGESKVIIRFDHTRRRPDRRFDRKPAKAA